MFNVLLLLLLLLLLFNACHGFIPVIPRISLSGRWPLLSSAFGGTSGSKVCRAIHPMLIGVVKMRRATNNKPIQKSEIQGSPQHPRSFSPFVTQTGFAKHLIKHINTREKGDVYLKGANDYIYAQSSAMEILGPHLSSMGGTP